MSPGPEADPELLARLEPMLEMLAADPASLSSVTSADEARDVHLADSLSGLRVKEIAEARRILDVGTGAGFPGVPLAAALPAARVTLLDSVGRKVEFIREVVERLGLENAEPVKARSEDWVGTAGPESYDVVTARAVAPLDALAELASPHLRQGGVLVAWKGDREGEGESRLATIRDKLAVELDRIEPVRPYRGSRERHLYVLRKAGPTPANLPRRAGMARKRPLAG